MSRIWESAAIKTIDLALGLLIRTRRRLLPPKPIVWQDPRPYRRVKLDELQHQLFRLQGCREHLAACGFGDEDEEELNARRGLMLEEILVRRGQKSKSLCGDC
ncbi:hypothetical protein HZC53_04895 [Candidatus Uhrbacteria bacterium]|nr:hypothetical protein [Candidatus Uhrbacteria bacterium]